ncbi:MAG: YjjG family noncanonical pyrimidine nucleotidase [Acidimicrobiia bacterium]|nr:YjjG family noncanonical pyrimidine nucleotidase [Acidimicrobiia bacterium]
MRYTTLLFDLDNTLFDASSCEPAAFDYALTTCGVDEPARYWETFTEINNALWDAVVRQELTPNEVQARRFGDLVAAAGLSADPALLAAEYVVGMGAYGELYPDALQILDQLGRHAALALVTNGLGEVVRARIKRLGLESRFDAIVISGEVGTSKPGSEIFDLAFARLGGPGKETALMVGDSLSSDIAGAVNYGIAACWYNPARKPRPDGIHIDHEVGSLKDLPELASGGVM